MAATLEKHRQHAPAGEGNQSSRVAGNGTTGRGGNRGGGRLQSHGKARPATAEERWIPVQAFGLGTDDFILAPKIDDADSEEALAAKSSSDGPPFGGLKVNHFGYASFSTLFFTTSQPTIPMTLTIQSC